MKTILVPTDLSPKTEYALDVAADLTYTYRADICLLNQVQYAFLPLPAADVSYETSEQLVEIYENTRKEAEDKLTELATNPRYAGLTIIPTVAGNLDSLIPNIHELYVVK